MFLILDSSTFLIRMNGAATRINRVVTSALAEMSGTVRPDLLINIANEITSYMQEVQGILDTAKTSGQYRNTIINVLKTELGDDFVLQTAVTNHRQALLQTIDTIANLLNTKPRSWGVDNRKLVQQTVSFSAAEATQVAQKLQAVKNTIIGV